MLKMEGKRKFEAASRHHLISKLQRNYATFAEQLMNPIPVSSKYLEHGKKFESVALMECEN